MTALPLATERLRLNLVDWAADVGSPNGGAESGAVGSLYNRTRQAATDPVEIYQRLNAGADGWVHQNVINLDVYNVKNFGAVGDGVTPDQVAIKAAIDAANAAGGGIVYFPPTATYYRISARIDVPNGATFQLSNYANITFMGDGAASRIVMDGDAGGAAWFLFNITGSSRNLRFVNLYMDGSLIVNPDPGEQTHILNITSSNAANPHDIDVIECYWGQIDGDSVRMVGSQLGGPVSNIRVINNDFTPTACRANVGFQRYTYRIAVVDNWMSGSQDQTLDFEPTGGVAPDNVPEEVLILGNQADNNSQNGTGWTLTGNGNTAPARRNILAYNILHNFSAVTFRDGRSWTVHGNVVVYTAPLGDDAAFLALDTIRDMAFTANIADRPNRVGQLFRAVLATAAGAGVKRGLLIADNVAKTYGDAGGGIAFGAENIAGVLMDGNVCTHVNGTVTQTIAYRVAASTFSIDNCQVNGNMVISQGLNMDAVAQLGVGGAVDARNLCGNANFGRGSGAGVRFVIAGGGTISGFRTANDNNCPSITGSVVALSSVTTGATIEGNPPGPRVLTSINVPAGAIGSPIGSWVLNTSGGEGTIFWYKETAAGGILDTAGWVSDGPGEYMFASRNLDATTTAARFMAPSLDQATVVTTEVQIPIVRAGTIRELRCDQVAGTGAGNNTHTLRLNGANTALTMTVAHTATSGSGTGSIAVVGGDLIALQITKSALPATSPTMVVDSVEITG